MPSDKPACAPNNDLFCVHFDTTPREATRRIMPDALRDFTYSCTAGRRMGTARGELGIRCECLRFTVPRVRKYKSRALDSSMPVASTRSRGGTMKDLAKPMSRGELSRPGAAQGECRTSVIVLLL